MAPLSSKEICALIVTYNIDRRIFRVVDCIKKQVDHIVIVDNGSQQTTRKYLRRIQVRNPSLKIFWNRKNKGIAAALNQGISYISRLKYRWVLTLDHDSFAFPSMVKELIKGYHQIKEELPKIPIGILAPIPFDQNTRRSLVPLDWPGEFLERSMVISSGSLINIEAFKRVGGFREDFFVYHVDSEFCLRLIRQGYKIFLIKKAKLWHQEGNKIIKRFFWRTVTFYNYSPLAYYYIFRNGIYFARNYAPPEKKWIIQRMFKDLVRIILYDKQRIKSLKLSFKGIFDGWRGKLGQLNL